ncbi:MAG: hypothetical protein ACRDJB_01940 [Actinomycetota bacterium]
MLIEDRRAQRRVRRASAARRRRRRRLVPVRGRIGNELSRLSYLVSGIPAPTKTRRDAMCPVVPVGHRYDEWTISNWGELLNDDGT